MKDQCHLNDEIVTSLLWKFYRASGSIISHELVFLPNGELRGLAHSKYESRWEIKDGVLYVFGENEELTTCFDSVKILDDGSFVMSGLWLVKPEINSVHILESRKRNFITEEILLKGYWKYRRIDGSIIANQMTFSADGSVGDGRSYNDSRWEVNGGILTVYGQDGTETIAFDKININENGRLRMEGRWKRNSNVTVIHVLEERPNRAISDVTVNRLHVNTSLSDSSESIIISFNSAGRPCNGEDTRWEFYQLPIDLCCDYFRISETWKPMSWYMNKILKIMDLLRSAMKREYRKVALCGVSAGGYASILFGELLSKEYKNTKFHTFSINPTLLHDEPHRTFIENVPHSVRLECISPEALALRDIGPANIPDIVALRSPRDGKNVSHKIYYDSGNQYEAYQNKFVSDLSSFSFHPYNLGKGHGAGAQEIYRTGVVHQAITKFLLGPV